MTPEVQRINTPVVTLAAFTLATLAWVGPVLAAPRTARSGHALRWQRSDITLSLAPTNIPSNLRADQALDALRTAAAIWSHSRISCAGLSLNVVMLPGDYPTANDGVNVVAFRKREWCRDGVMRRGQCYDPRAAAMTTVHHGAVIRGSNDRAIDDADIELNAHDFGWHTTEPATSAAIPTIDLREALKHEIGHVLGFAHVCEPAGRVRHAASSCADLPTTERVSTMLPGVDSVFGPLPSQRQLTPTDIAALCAVYPAPTITERTFGCGVPRTRSSSSTFVLPGSTLALALLMANRRRRQRRPRVRPASG